MGKPSYAKKEAAEKQANLANIIKALKTLGKRTALFGGTGLAGYGIGRGHGFDSGQESIKDMSLKEIMDLSMPKKEAAEATTSDLAKGVIAGGVAGAGAGVGHNYLQNRKNYNNLVKADMLDYVEHIARHGGFKGKLTPLRMTNFKGSALKGGLGGAGLGLLLAALMGGKEKEASAIQELAKEAGKRGLWDNIHAKRKRGEKPAKKGDKDYPDEKSWKKTTKASK